MPALQIRLPIEKPLADGYTGFVVFADSCLYEGGPVEISSKDTAGDDNSGSGGSVAVEFPVERLLNMNEIGLSRAVFQPQGLLLV